MEAVTARWTPAQPLDVDTEQPLAFCLAVVSIRSVQERNGASIRHPELGLVTLTSSDGEVSGNVVILHTKAGAKILELKLEQGLLTLLDLEQKMSDAEIHFEFCHFGREDLLLLLLGFDHSCRDHCRLPSADESAKGRVDSLDA